MAATDTKVPEDLRYTEDHEWVKVEEGNRVRIGITDYAQDSLTDVVYVELPGEDEEFGQGDSLGVVESTKSVSDVYAPLAGKIVAVNGELEDNPELVNEDPYGKGWFLVMEIEDPSAVEKLLDAAAYREFLENEE